MDRLHRTLGLGGLLLGLTGAAGAQTVTWQASMGVLPDDPAIPAEHRFTLGGELGFLSLGSTLAVLDDVRAKAANIQKHDLAPILSTDEWSFTVSLQMHSDDRDPGTIDLGNVLTVRDDTRAVHFAIDASQVGFVEESGNAWLSGLTYTMNSSDRLHEFKVVKAFGQVELFVDSSPIAALSLPYTAFPSTGGGPLITMVGTSTVGIADFEIERYEFRRDPPSLDFAIFPPLVKDGDALALESRHAVPGTPNFLYVTAVNGTPLFLRILQANANGLGVWRLDTTTPPGLAGIELRLVEIGRSQATGNWALSNFASLAFH